MMMAAWVTEHPPGDTAKALRVGDILLTGVTSRRFVSRAIKFGAWLRRFDAKERQFSHAALIIGEDGDLAEALGDGVKQTHIAKYAPADYVVIHTDVDEHDQQQVSDFAHSVLREKTKYDRLEILGLAIYCLTGAQLCIQKAGTAICSGFVSDALTRSSFIWPRPPFAMMPADLARYFRVQLDDPRRITADRSQREPVGSK
jgi:hypothetical protein